MKRPRMIGAHVPKKITGRRSRCRLNESAEMLNRAYDERFVAKAWRSHLVYQPLFRANAS